MNQQTVTKETFRKFGLKFQSGVISACIKDYKFYQQIQPICRETYFSSDGHKSLWKIINNYYEQYNNVPNVGSIEIELGKLEDSDLKEMCGNIIKEIVDLTEVELKHVRDTAHEFCADKEMIQAIYDSLKFLEKNQRDAIRARVEKALKHYHTESPGHNYFEELDQRTLYDMRKTVPTGFKMLDHVDFLDGGLANGELGVIMAPTGGGKSFWLVQFGYAALKAGINVVHYTFELSEVNVGRRYDSRITGFPTKMIKSNIDLVRDKLNEFEGGKLIIKEFPTKTANINKLKFHYDRLLSSGFKPGLIITDYADLMRSTKEYEQKVWELEAIYEEFRAFLMETKIPGWTASQTNRSGAEGTVTLDKIADGYVKAQVADFVAGFSRDKLYVAKNRIGRDHVNFEVDFRPEIAKIDILEMQTDTEQEMIGSMIKDVYREFRDEKGLSEVVNPSKKKG